MVTAELVDFVHYTGETNAVRKFIDWLYEEGPEPDSMPREQLLGLYLRHMVSERKG